MTENNMVDFPQGNVPADPFEGPRAAARALAVSTNAFNSASKDFPNIPPETREIYMYQLNLKLREYNHWLNDFQSMTMAIADAMKSKVPV